MLARDRAMFGDIHDHYRFEYGNLNLEFQVLSTL